MLQGLTRPGKNPDQKGLSLDSNKYYPPTHSLTSQAHFKAHYIPCAESFFFPSLSLPLFSLNTIIATP